MGLAKEDQKGEEGATKISLAAPSSRAAPAIEAASTTATPADEDDGKLEMAFFSARHRAPRSMFPADNS